MSRSTVLIVMRETLTRHMIVERLRLDKRLRLIAEAGGSCAATWLSTEIQPDFVIIGIPMPLVNGESLTTHLRRAQPGLRILAIAEQTDPFVLSRGMQDQVQGFIDKKAPLSEFVEAVNAVLEGGTYFSESYRQLQGRIESDPNGFQKILSEREQQVLGLIAEGLPSRTIASRLGLSTRTVETHRYNIMKKMDFDDMAAMMRFALTGGFTYEECDPDHYPCESCRDEACPNSAASREPAR